jgi:hypothetical protein
LGKAGSGLPYFLIIFLSFIELNFEKITTDMVYRIGFTGLPEGQNPYGRK